MIDDKPILFTDFGSNNTGVSVIEVLKTMNRLCMHVMGDMNWHAHCGINTYPIRVAVETHTPLIIWGKHGFMDIGGMHSYNDFVEFSYRNRHEQTIEEVRKRDHVKPRIFGAGSTMSDGPRNTSMKYTIVSAIHESGGKVLKENGSKTTCGIWNGIQNRREQ